MKSKEKILILISGGLGDFIFNIPAIDILRSSRPNLEIHFLHYSSFSLTYKAKVKSRSINSSPWSFLLKDKAHDFTNLDNLSFKEFLKLRKKIKKNKFKNILIFSAPTIKNISILKKRFLLYFLGISIFSNFFSVVNIFNKNSKILHKAIGPIMVIKSFLKQLPIKGHSPLNNSLSEYISENDKKMRNFKILENNNPNLIFFPGFNFEFKDWGIENYIKLSELTLERFKNIKNIYIAGPPKDKNIVNNFKNSKVSSICGINFEELCQYIHKASCVIGNDGGGMQLSGYLGAKTIVLSNGSEPNLVTPLGKNVIELRRNINCSPCFSYTFCPENHSKCVRDISVQQVLRSLDNLLIG